MFPLLFEGVFCIVWNYRDADTSDGSQRRKSQTCDAHCDHGRTAPIAINEKLSKRVEMLLRTKYTNDTMYTRKVVKSLSKTVSVSARINEDLFNAFKDAYLDQLKGSFKEDTPEEIVKSLSNPSNSELVALAFSFGLKGIKGQQEG